MIVKDLKRLISNGESLTVEFKECKSGVNRDVYKTIGAFLNRNGGHIILGVNDKGKAVGINRDALPQIKKNLVTSLNNPEKINPPLYLLPEEFEISGKIVLYLSIPESSQVHRINGRIFDRNEDGDFDITLQSQSVAELYIRKQSSYSENRIYPFVNISDLRNDLITRIRKMISSRQPSHPWVYFNDFELLKSARLFQKDYRTKEEGFTLAAIMLLGKDEVIQSVLPHHKTDAILRVKNRDRYDDRDDIRTNLIESYDRLSAFVTKHLPDPFYLEGDIRISLRDTIFREVISNLLIHREFLNGFPAKLIIENDKVITENGNRPHGYGIINPQNFSPFPKNPIIARFFKEIGRADELGSGVRNLFKYTKIYSGIEPQLLEADIFKTTIPLTHNNTKHTVIKDKKTFDGVNEKNDGVTVGVNNDTNIKAPHIQSHIIESINNISEQTLNNTVVGVIDSMIVGVNKQTKAKLVILLKAIIQNEGNRIPFYSNLTKLGSLRTIERYFKQLKETDLIEFIGNAPRTGGYYLTERIKNIITTVIK